MGCPQGRAWYRYGATLIPAPRPGQLTDDIELRPEPLPSTGGWQTAVKRAAALLGIPGPNYLTGAAVAELTTQIRSELGERVAAVRELPDRLRDAYSKVKLPMTGKVPGRLNTATGELP